MPGAVDRSQSSSCGNRRTKPTHMLGGLKFTDAKVLPFKKTG
jgi:hypothetical protein